MTQETNPITPIASEEDEIKYEDTEDEEINFTEIPKKVRVFHTQAYDKSVSDLVSMIKEHDISLNPDYQRNYIWDNKKASLLIESILLNVPIPVIYVAEETDNTWTVVDGLQRLNSLRRFYDNEYRLTGLEILSELNGIQFSKLNPKATRILKNGIIRIIVILQESDPEIKYDIFLRLNRGSIHLNEQELRNCLYRGKFNELLKSLRQNTNYLKCLKIDEPNNRFYDAELILRYFAISDSWDYSNSTIYNYKNKMKNFLNTYMESKLKITDRELTSLTEKFNNTVEKVYLLFGNDAFVRSDPVGGADYRVNRALMDVVMLGTERLTKEQIIGHKQKLIELHRNLPKRDVSFNDALIYGTNDTKKLEYRISTWLNELDKIVWS
jgi:hypothetical protein